MIARVHLDIVFFRRCRVSINWSQISWLLEYLLLHYAVVFIIRCVRRTSNGDPFMLIRDDDVG